MGNRLVFAVATQEVLSSLLWCSMFMCAHINLINTSIISLLLPPSLLPPSLSPTQIGVSLSYAVWAVSHSFPLFVLARIVAGVSKGNISISTAVVVDVTDVEKRNRGMVRKHPFHSIYIHLDTQLVVSDIGYYLSCINTATLESFICKRLTSEMY